MAISVLERGYYQQALETHVRMAMEDMLVAEDVEVCPKTLELLLHGDPNDKVRLGRGDLSYGAMSARISPEAAEAWKRTYDAVSVYATHPRSTGLQTLVTWGGKNLPHLSLNPHYDRQQLAVCVELVAKESMNLVKTVVQLLHDTGSDWQTRAYPCFTALEELIDETREISGLPLAEITAKRRTAGTERPSSDAGRCAKGLSAPPAASPPAPAPPMRPACHRQSLVRFADSTLANRIRKAIASVAGSRPWKGR